MVQQEIKIALCGAGNVGGAVLELLTVNADFYKKTVSYTHLTLPTKA